MSKNIYTPFRKGEQSATAGIVNCKGIDKLKESLNKIRDAYEAEHKNSEIQAKIEIIFIDEKKEPIDNNEECYLTASIQRNGEKFLSLKDFAEVMGVTKYVAAKIINSGEIKDYGSTKITMLKIEDVKNYIKKLKNGKQA